MLPFSSSTDRVHCRSHLFGSGGRASRRARRRLPRRFLFPAPRRQVLEAPYGESCPSGLVARSHAAPRVSVEVLVKQNQVAPAGVARVALVFAMAGAPATPVRKEEGREAPRQLLRDLREVHEDARSHRALHSEPVTIEMMVALQRLDEEVVDRKPDRPAPVGVASEEPGRGLARIVFDAVFLL